MLALYTAVLNMLFWGVLCGWQILVAGKLLVTRGGVLRVDADAFWLGWPGSAGFEIGDFVEGTDILRTWY